MVSWSHSVSESNHRFFQLQHGGWGGFGGACRSSVDPPHHIEREKEQESLSPPPPHPQTLCTSSLAGRDIEPWRRYQYIQLDAGGGEGSEGTQCNPLGVKGDTRSKLMSASQSSRSHTESVAFSWLCENCEIRSNVSSCSIHSTTLGIMLI